MCKRRRELKPATKNQPFSSTTLNTCNGWNETRNPSDWAVDLSVASSEMYTHFEGATPALCAASRKNSRLDLSMPSTELNKSRLASKWVSRPAFFSADFR